MNPAELIAQRRQTRAYIKANPVSVAFHRKVPVSDGAGGHTTERIPLVPQEVKLTKLAIRANIERRTEAGVTVAANAVLIGTHDLDVQKADIFTLDGGKYEVLFVDPNRDYQTTAEVLYTGG